MPHSEVTSAHVQIPADCLPLLAELVARLGGKMVGPGGEGFPALPMPEVERGGKMLKALRQRAGLTQKALADVIGIPQSHISDFEKNRRAVPYKYAQRLAEALHSIPSHFMTPNAKTIAAMNESGDKEKKHDSPAALYQDLGI